MKKNKRSPAGGHSPAEERLKESVRALEPYSTPHIPCRIRLDGNEGPLGLPQGMLQRVEEALSRVEFNRYPDPEARELKKTLSALFGVDTSQILLGNGSDELIVMLLAAFSGGTGRVLYPSPTFSMYGISSRVLGLETIEVPLNRAFDIDLDATLYQIDSRDPDLLFLASPNNPTGNCFSREKIMRIIEASRGIVVVDEAYCDFSGKTLLPILDDHPNLVLLRTLSKIGFASLRLGFLFASREIVAQTNKARLPYNINSLTQSFAGIILQNPSFITETVQMVVKERERLYRALSPMEGVKAYPSDANFHLLRVEDAERVFDELVKRGILVRNLSSRGALENCLRVTVGTPEENDAFLETLSEILSRND